MIPSARSSVAHSISCVQSNETRSPYYQGVPCSCHCVTVLRGTLSVEEEIE